MTLRVAQFFLKIAHLSFSMGPRGPRAYGLRPRLWLLFQSETYPVQMRLLSLYLAVLVNSQLDCYAILSLILCIDAHVITVATVTD